MLLSLLACSECIRGSGESQDHHKEQFSQNRWICVSAGQRKRSAEGNCRTQGQHHVRLQLSRDLRVFSCYLFTGAVIVACLPQQEAWRWLVPAVLQGGGLWLPRHHIRQHDCGQHHHAGDKYVWMNSSNVCKVFLHPSLSSACLCVYFSWCPNPISSMWWWCLICMGTWWATCVQAWWEGLALCLALIMVGIMPSLKRWVFSNFWRVDQYLHMHALTRISRVWLICYDIVSSSYFFPFPAGYKEHWEEYCKQEHC